MLPIPRIADQLVKEWAQELSEFTGHLMEHLVENPQCFDFPNGLLRIVLMDDSVVEFHRAFHIVSERNKAIAVFTEHCGHHVFPFHEAKVFRDGILVYDKKHV